MANTDFLRQVIPNKPWKRLNVVLDTDVKMGDENSHGIAGGENVWPKTYQDNSFIVFGPRISQC